MIFLRLFPHDFIKCPRWYGEIEHPSVERDNRKRANYNSFLIHEANALWWIDGRDEMGKSVVC